MPIASDAADLLRRYLDEISGVPLLTAAQEVELARAIEVGVFADERLATRADDVATRADLGQLVHEGRRAKQNLINANLRLVVAIARRVQGNGLGLLDLVQEGNVGLIRAVEKFDYARGFKFSTYAVWWIRQSMSRAVAEQGRTIRLPVAVVESVRRVATARATLAADLGREPTPAEVAVYADLSPDRVDHLASLRQAPLSLSAQIGDERAQELGELLEDVESPTPHELAATALLQVHVAELLARLAPTDRTVIDLRFGISDGQQRSLEDVARITGLPRDRVRNAEARSLAMLRRPGYADVLRDYLEA